jgi:hypothetical protein
MWGFTMTEASTEEADLKQAVSKLDDDGSNPFWPKGAGGAGQPDSPDVIAFDSVTFAPGNSANVIVNVHTTPAGQAWDIDYGDGTQLPIAAGTNTSNHTYTVVTPGTKYTIKITCLTDSDTRNIQY